ncbi:aspartyl-phosphate phosphatase Spo0E family protein [Paenibacillus sp. LHD-117]|uniref:aspartyl-phosphate phosphatase Spo0E family protein n=1 Tax=Paenibacillus sp. LHD-117 TaxID=3071412 RepID=UPI0027DEE189|nr:aspartyl-phosphate phosphatase Spo0E family protein [Paenibacillus sp. LHD-117]MDQ6422797.1 aspartyl-phosphate phosphatase Spo0E family protein [Paenibacillus sp. LHD-117]
MNLCECRNRIERLRRIMELTFDTYGSFTAPSVLEASQSLDDALVQYRQCPQLEACNSSGKVSWQEVDQVQLCSLPKKKKIAG